MFPEQVQQIYNEFISSLERNLDSNELLNSTTLEFLHSEAPGRFVTIQKLAEGHCDSAADVFYYSALQEHESNLEVLNSSTSNRDEQADELNNNQRKKRANIEGQKDFDRTENNRAMLNIEQILNEFATDMASRAARTIYARDLEDRIYYFRNETRHAIEEALTNFQKCFNNHTEEIYAFLKTETQKYEKTFLDLSGFNEKEQAKQEQNPETVYTPELLEHFQSGNVDVMELPPEIAALYIDYLFSDLVIDKGLSGNAAAFHSEPSVDDIALNKIRKSNRAAFHDGSSKRPDIAPELQPLSPEELKEYNRNVAKGRKAIDEMKDKSPEKDTKNLDDEMPISLL